MKRATLIVAAGSALVAAGIGCGGRWMVWNAKPAAPAVAGKIMITVADHREVKKGGDDPRVVGQERNGWGIPFAIRLPTPTEYAESVRDLIGQAALTAGIGVAPAGDMTGTARIQIDVAQGWCDGYFPVYKANLAGTVALLGPDGAPRMQPMAISVDDGAGDCHSAYRKMLTKLYDTAVGMMSSPQFKDAATAGAPGGAPPPPPPAAAPAGN
jgi:hypothetical protein